MVTMMASSVSKIDAIKLGSVITELTLILNERKNAEPDSSYVASLYHKGLDQILKKVGEECTEVVIAAKNEVKNELVYEVADLWFHTLVLLANEGLSAQDVMNELERRFGLSGIDEKNARKEK